MSINRPTWKHSAVEILTDINAALVKRLNTDAQPAGLWKVETGQLNLSKPGHLRIIWSIKGGPIARGFPSQGPDMPAKCVGIWRCKLLAEVRVNEPRTEGITPADLLLGEEVQRALLLVWNEKRQADFDEEDPVSDWEPFTGNPGQREVGVTFAMPIAIMILGDPYLFKTITSVESTGDLV